MKKSELKAGMFVETTCGYKGIVLNTEEGLIISFQDNLYSYLSSYSDDLQEIDRTEWELDIHLVWDECNHYDLTKRPEDCYLLWERNEPL